MQIVKLIKVEKDPLFGNLIATVETDRFGTIRAVRQGGLGIWAFPQRPKLSENEKHIFDDALDCVAPD